MGKQSGLGDNYFAGGYDLSGDTNSLTSIASPLAPIDVTSIKVFGHERIGGLHDGDIQWVSYFNPATAQAHPVLSALPTSDIGVMYCRGTALGSPVASMVGKQINYDPTRSTAGDLTFKVQVQANGYGLSWGQLLTAGIRTDTTATNGASINTTAATSFGWVAYLQAFAFTGTDVTVTIQDSADNTTWANLTSGVFAQLTAGRQTQRLAVGGTATVRQYVRAITTTVGGFTSLAFAVALTKYQVASDI